jgi:uncharacterized protein (TIGR02246 family)
MSSSGDNKRLVREAFDALARADSRPLVDLFAEDAVWTMTGTSSWSRAYRGKQAILDELLRSLAVRLAGRYRATAERILADGDFVVVQAQGHAATQSGQRYDNQYCFVYRMADGKIQEVTEYLDTRLVDEALGDPRLKGKEP